MPMSNVTWTCARCGRRVPNRVSQCHCGMSREEAEQLAPLPVVRPLPLTRPRRRSRGLDIRWRDVWADLTWDLRALVIGIVVILLAGVGWVFVPRTEAPIVPVLGVLAPAPSPSPSPTPKPPAKAKRRWWPW
jgi:hypothetical protein